MLTVEHKKELEIQAALTRYKTVKLIYDSKSGHTGGDLSSTEIMVALFDIMKHDPANPKWEERDIFFLSKGHCAETYYALLNIYGYIKDEDIESYGSFNSLLGGHPTKSVMGVESNTGSLGHGLGLGAGAALGLQMNNRSNRVFVLSGDGELAEGSIWEAAMMAAKYQLSSLTWIIDRNHLQISGNTESVMPLEDLALKIRAFGFDVIEVNGHDFNALFEAIECQETSAPKCIIAHTIKGKGLKEAENVVSWHHKVPIFEHVETLRKEYLNVKGVC